jgi:hypothetical protein
MKYPNGIRTLSPKTLQIIDFLNKNTYKHCEIADIVKTSPEYISKVARRLGIKRRNYTVTKPAKMLTLTCKQCGIEFRRFSCQVNPESFAYFCSKTCFGKYIGQHYGFHSHKK